MSSRPGNRGFTLLEMIVATLVMSIAVVTLLSGLSGATRNAAHLRDYDRVAQLARLRMNELLADTSIKGGASGVFDPALTGGIEAGWQATVAMFEGPAEVTPDTLVLDRVQLEVWWKSGPERRTFTLEGFRERSLNPAGPPP